MLLGGFLGVLCVLAVNADLQFNRQDAKDAKKSAKQTICCTVNLRAPRVSVVKLNAPLN